MRPIWTALEQRFGRGLRSRAAPSRSRICVWNRAESSASGSRGLPSRIVLVDAATFLEVACPGVVCPCGRRLSLEHNESTTTTTSRRVPLHRVRWHAIRGPWGATGSRSPPGTGRLRGDAGVHHRRSWRLGGPLRRQPADPDRAEERLPRVHQYRGRRARVPAGQRF